MWTTKKPEFIFVVFFLLIVGLKCSNDNSDGIIFQRDTHSVKYQLWKSGWHDTLAIYTSNYDSGISYIEDALRKKIILFDNYGDLIKINSETGIIEDTMCIVCRYWKFRNTKKNKLLYAYPALFYYHDEVLVHLDMEFNVQAYYLDSMSQVIDARYPNGYRYEMYIDSVRLLPPDKVWVRKNDRHGNVEVMIFGVNATMEAPVIYSTYIFR